MATTLASPNYNEQFLDSYLTPAILLSLLVLPPQSWKWKKKWLPPILSPTVDPFHPTTTDQHLTWHVNVVSREPTLPVSSCWRFGSHGHYAASPNLPTHWEPAAKNQTFRPSFVVMVVMMVTTWVEWKSVKNMRGEVREDLNFRSSSKMQRSTFGD